MAMKKADLLINNDFISDLLWENHNFSKPKTLKNSFWLNLNRYYCFYHHNQITINYRVEDVSQWTFSYQSLNEQKWKAVLINDPNLKTIVHRDHQFHFSKKWKFPSYSEHLLAWAVEVLDLSFDESDFKSVKVRLKLLKPIWIKPVTNLKIVDWQTIDYQYLAPLDRTYFHDLIAPVLVYVKLFLIDQKLDRDEQLIEQCFKAIKLINAKDDQSYFYQMIAHLDRYFGTWWAFNVSLIYCEPKLMWISLYEHWFKRLKAATQLLLKKIQAIKNPTKQSNWKDDYLIWIDYFQTCEVEIETKRQMIIEHYYHKAFYHQSDNDKQVVAKTNPNKQEQALPIYVGNYLDQLEADAKATKRYDSYYYVSQIIKALPWTITKPLRSAKQWLPLLNQIHQGLDDVKNDLLGFLAEIAHFQNLNNKHNEFKPLCFVGPPGVGKTTLAKAFAKAAGLELIKIACGTIMTVDDWYGQNPVWNGARAGIIIKSLQNAQANNPVILLDEIDKINNPAIINACLDLLDPQNNGDFYDHFIQIPFNLKNVIFIATANDLSNIHPALVDRLEIINFKSYDQNEMVTICQTVTIFQVLALYGWSDDLAKVQILKDEVVNIVAKYHHQGLRKIKEILRQICRQWLKDEYGTLMVQN